MSYKIDKPNIEPQKVSAFTRTILNWFGEHGNRYPWRENASPYEILVAEIFLQRTQAKQVAPVYERFIARFPNPAAIAQADTSEIEESLFPLGLQKKVGHLKDTAKDLVKLHHGQIPSEISELVKLKGIGRYTANAVLVFGFGYRLPVVDANVIRLFERVFGLKSLKKRPRTDQILWEFAQSILPSQNIRGYTWGLIDFSNNVCSPRQPDCSSCPMRCICIYRTEELQKATNCIAT